MKKIEYNTIANITTDGNVAIYKAELQEWAKQWRGRKVMIHFSILPTEQSEAMKGYYYKYIVPTFRQALLENGERMTDKQTEFFLRSNAPVMVTQEPDRNGFYIGKVKEINEITNEEFIEYIDTLKQFGAEEFGIYIEEPHNLINNKQ